MLRGSLPEVDTDDSSVRTNDIINSPSFLFLEIKDDTIIIRHFLI